MSSTNAGMSEENKTRYRNGVIGLLFGLILVVAIFFGVTNASKSASYTPPMNIPEVEQKYHIDIINEEGMSFDPASGCYIVQAYDAKGAKSAAETPKVRTFYAKVSGSDVVLFVKDAVGYGEVLR